MAATMAMLSTKCINTPNAPKMSKTQTPTKPISLVSIPNLSSTTTTKDMSSSLTGSAIAGAVFATLSACEPAMAAQQIAQIAEGDNRGIALLLPLVPAIGWVLFNIFQPALNQLNRMRNAKGVMIGLGLGASGLMLMPPPQASAALSELASIGEAAAAAAPPTDNRGTLLLFVVAPAILWVLYNILQPALNQINRMRSD